MIPGVGKFIACVHGILHIDDIWNMSKTSGFPIDFRCISNPGMIFFVNATILLTDFTIDSRKGTGVVKLGPEKRLDSWMIPNWNELQMFGTGQSDTKLESMTQQQGIYICLLYTRMRHIYYYT